MLERYPSFAELIDAGSDPEAYVRLRRAESIGGPLGDDAFIARLEAQTRRALKPRKRGPKPSQPDEAAQGN